MTGAERIPVTDLVKNLSGKLLIDVRSPKEFFHAHIPGAYNVPLFNDEERKVVGTIYKQESKSLAIKRGLDFFGPKMRLIVEAVERLVDGVTTDTSEATLYLYCWRGGMRSAAVAWLLQLYGFRVMVLSGGYKSYRRWCLQAFQKPYPLRILGGYTGSGKTEVLYQLKEQGELIIDLEGVACHKGSAFGKAGAQPSQEMFENELALCLYQAESFLDGVAPFKSIWIEDESQRIGHLTIPQSFWQQMRQSPIFFLDIPFEERLQHIADEYGGLDKSYLAGGIQRISKRLGGVETKHALIYLEEGNLLECFRILLTYYDKRYLKGLHNRDGLSSLLTKSSSSSVSSANANLLLTNLTTI